MTLRTFTERYLPAPLFETLKHAKYNIERWTYPRYVVSHHYGPFTLTMNIRDRVAREWYDRNWELPAEIDFLSRGALQPGALVFDLGAHQCLIAMMLAKLVDPVGKVIAVEANAHNAAVAGLNVKRNGITNIEILHALVSDRTGTDLAAIGFNSSKAALAAGTQEGERVESLTIDELSRRFGWPQVVYMDIEGFEIDALKGAVKTLACGCAWFIELHGDTELARYGARNDDLWRFFPADMFTAHLLVTTDKGFRLLRNRGALPHERCFVIFTPDGPGVIRSDVPAGSTTLS